MNHSNSHATFSKKKKKKKQITDCNKIIWVQESSWLNEPFNLISVSWNDHVVCRFMEIYLPMRQFFHNLIHPEYSAVTDVYVLMFLADTVDFIIIVFGYAAFGVRLVPRSWFSPWDLPAPTSTLVPASPSETLGRGHHFVSVRGSGPRAVPSHGADPVWEHGGGPRPLPQEVRHGKGHLSGHPSLWNPLLDVLHPAGNHRKVRTQIKLT